jgi:hypothetical protein
MGWWSGGVVEWWSDGVKGFLGGGERMERSSRTTLVVHYMHDESERILYPHLKLLLDLENSLAG